jgi:hypothetical protein
MSAYDPKADIHGGKPIRPVLTQSGHGGIRPRTSANSLKETSARHDTFMSPRPRSDALKANYSDRRGG